jgi:hypothetical protein
MENLWTPGILESDKNATLYSRQSHNILEKKTVKEIRWKHRQLGFKV